MPIIERTRRLRAFGIQKSWGIWEIQERGVEGVARNDSEAFGLGRGGISVRIGFQGDFRNGGARVRPRDVVFPSVAYSQGKTVLVELVQTLGIQGGGPTGKKPGSRG